MKAPHIVFQHIVRHSSPVRPAQPKSTAPSFLQRFAERLLQKLSAAEQIQVTEKFDRSGNSYYQIYDRHSGQTHTFHSRQDALTWLDRQQYRA